MNDQGFRILRVLEYTGTREFIDTAIGGRSVKGSREFRTGTIREVILHEYPEHLDPLPDQFCYTLPNGECVSDDPRCMHQPKEELLLSITLRQLRIANVSRCAQVFHSVQAWTPERWSNAMAGECGEVCNAVKKLNRLADGTNTEKDPQTEAECVALIGEELADVIIYADLLAARLGIDLDSAVRDKFNQVSILRGATQRL